MFILFRNKTVSMNTDEALKKLLRSFEHYYDIKLENAVPPFAAEAEFHQHQEQYILVRAAHVSDVDSNEYVFFYTCASLSKENLAETAEKAWKEGLSRVKVYPGHRNSDVILIILADKIDEDALKQVKKIKYYKSYAFSFRGWSHFKLVAMETFSKKLASNRLGKDLKKLFKTIN